MFTIEVGYNVSKDLELKGCTSLASDGSIARNVPFVSKFLAEIQRFISAQIIVQDLPIWHGTLSAPYPIEKKHLYTILTSSPLALYNMFTGTNAYLGRTEMSQDNISFFIATTTPLDNAGVPIPECVDYYLFFLTI